MTPNGLPRRHDALLHPLADRTIFVQWNADGLRAATLEEPRDSLPAPGEALRLFPLLASLFRDGRGDLSALPFALEGTAFQQSIWRRIATIPFGETISYTRLAADVGHPDAVRAAGAACGRNPLPLVIPCHRVVTASGGLGGFVWGIAMKQALLAREARPYPLAA